MAFLCRTAETSYPARTDPNPDERWLYSLAILFGVYLRVAWFWKPSLWLDELATAYAAMAGDWPTLWQRVRFEVVHPPTYYAVVKFLLVFGQNEFFLRLPSVIFGVASIIVLMMTMNRVAGSRAALYSGAIYALNSQAILYSQEARMYGMALFAATVSVYFFAAIIEDGRASLLFGYASATLLACYSHLLYSSVLLGQVALSLFFLFFFPVRPKNLRRLVITQMALLLLLAPMAPLFVSANAARGTLFGWVPQPNLESLVGFFGWPETALAVLLLIVSLPRLWVRRERLLSLTPAQASLLWLGMVYFAIWPFAVILARLGLINIVYPRYLLLSLLGAVIVTVIVIVKADDPLLRTALWTFVGLVAVLQAVIAIKRGPWAAAHREDWRGAISWVQARYRAGDVILLRSGLTPAKVLSPSIPGAEEYLASPLCGFYDRGGMNVVNLPWRAEDLHSSPFTPPGVQEKVSHSRQIFVLMNAQLDGWNWELLEKWIQEPGRPPRRVEKRAFQKLEVRVYRLASDGPG